MPGPPAGDVHAHDMPATGMAGDRRVVVAVPEVRGLGTGGLDVVEDVPAYIVAGLELHYEARVRSPDGRYRRDLDRSGGAAVRVAYRRLGGVGRRCDSDRREGDRSYPYQAPHLPQFGALPPLRGANVRSVRPHRFHNGSRDFEERHGQGTGKGGEGP